MKIKYIFTLIGLLHLNFLCAQTTFEWNTATDNGNDITETLSGITVTFIGTNDPSSNLLINSPGGFCGSSGNVIWESTLTTLVTFSFSQPVDITSILAMNGNGLSNTYTFNPTGGCNAPVVTSIVNGCAPPVNLNWTNVTSFTVTTPTTNQFGFDDLVLIASAGGTGSSPTSSTDTITACDSYLWVDGNTYTSSNNTAKDTLSNAAGCDSIVTLDLTLNYSTTGTDTITTCDSLIWIDGNTYISSNNTATHMLINATGCDSLVTLDFTLNSSTTGTDTITACDSYLWIDGNTYTSSNNTAKDTISNAAGCDSIVTLDLTLNYSTTRTDTITTCNSYIWIDGNTYTSSNNTATHALTNAVGCDSIVTLNLTIDTVNTSVIINVIGGPPFSTQLSAQQVGATYQWLNCPSMSIISGETGQDYAIPANGDYAVIVSNGTCIDTSACVTITGVGILENDFEAEFLLYPNPASDYLKVDFGIAFNNGDLKIMNGIGQIVYTETVNASQTVINTAELANGVYHVVFNVNNGRAVKRLVIQR
jgi:hypothetical protein